MAGGLDSFRKYFRTSEAQRGGDATSTLGQLRAKCSPSEYATLFAAFRSSAPKTLRALTHSGPLTPSELVWRRRALSPLALDNELRWASQWLPIHVRQLNKFRQCASAIQRQVVTGELEGALYSLDAHVQGAGWSLWAVELRAALLQLSRGSAEQKEWLDQLQLNSVNSIPGLLFQVFSDRNDDTYSYDAVYSKCMSSFPRFDSIAPWLLDYLKFRALSHIDDPLAAIPNVLCRDITSALVDYYEDVVEAIAQIEIDVRLESSRASAASLVACLLSAGYEDHRLRKLGLALDRNQLPEQIDPQPSEFCRALYVGRFTPERDALPASIASDIEECENYGAAAHEVVGKVLKWGVNLRGLDIGPAVALTALYATSTARGERVLPLSNYLASNTVCVDDAAALSREHGASVLLSYLSQRGVCVAKDELLKPSKWGIESAFPDGGPVYLWLAICLLDASEFGELEWLLCILAEKSPYWERQTAKIAVLASIKQGALEAALDVIERWYGRSSLYSFEFPAAELFREHRWADFKNFDPVKVGLVAHFQFESSGDARVGYVCKMACRAFLNSGMRERVATDFEIALPPRKAQLISFLRDVWIEQNLSMCHQFQSTAEVREERMGVLQLLLAWEVDRSADYAEAIKDLTFDQTLQRGLERIDQARIFVNESAISRWAEKDLEIDYERWRKLSESNSGGRTVDDMLRQYALDPKNTEVLTDFANGKPTAADTLLIDLLDRLFERFLLDPTDGLDTYLSLRIRHGSLRGTILGPLEENGLLYSTSGFSEAAFAARWDDVLRLPPMEKAQLVSLMQEFSRDVRRVVDDFVDQKVQVQRPEKPEGAFQRTLSPGLARLFASSLAERPPSFHAFLCSGYFVFWKFMEVSLVALRTHVGDVLAPALHARVERLVQKLRSYGPGYLPLVSTLTTASTMTKSQCDSVADWFQLPSAVGGEKYQLQAAIEIASVATRNIHRASSTNVNLLCFPATPLPLTTSGLAVLMDCLFVFFENAWKHSGLAEKLPPIDLLAEYDPHVRLLTLTCRNALADRRREVLVRGQLSLLRTKYLGELPLELISLEGGSGFPKLARLTRSVPRDACPHPFDFGIEDDRWYTRLTLPLYEREGAYEAYE